MTGRPKSCRTHARPVSLLCYAVAATHDLSEWALRVPRCVLHGYLAYAPGDPLQGDGALHKEQRTKWGSEKQFFKGFGQEL